MAILQLQNSDPTPNNHWVLPIEVVARHEVGHAIAAHRCGGRVKRIVFGTTASGEHFGNASFEIPTNEHHYVLVQSAGSLALFLHDCPSAPCFSKYLAWVATEDGYAKGISGVGDWMEILRRTCQPEGRGLDDFLERAVEPYFEDTCRLLTQSPRQIDELTFLLLDHPPGLGPLALERFFAGKPPSSWAFRFDRLGVRWESEAKMREACKE